MGAGKSTLGPELAARLGRPFVSIDHLVEVRTGSTVPELFEERGEAVFRELEEQVAAEVIAARRLAVVELGGGALGSPRTRGDLAESAFTVLVDVTPDEAWGRVSGSGRPLAVDGTAFRALYAERRPVYEAAADARARDVDGALLASAGVEVGEGALRRLGELVPGDGSVELVTDGTVSGLHGQNARAALRTRLSAWHEVPPGEAAKSLAHAELLWSSLRLDRGGTVVALGGGSTLDLSGFVAAGYLRGVAWAPVPTTLVAQVDAAIGGKTAVNVSEGKNLVGAFHWPARVVVDPALLATLPEEEVRNGLAEVVKTGLLAGEPWWELASRDQVRRCAAFKAAVCMRDPLERGERAQLNLGHTFAHALEAASGYELPHGRALALGLLAALRLSGLEGEASLVEDLLQPRPVHVDRDTALATLGRDKKAERGGPRLVLLDAPGRPRWGVALESADIRAALDALIV